MLKSVLTAIPSYAMTCFLLPVSLCSRIQSVLTRFWWDASPETRKICFVAWEKLTRPKAQGGLGIREIQTFNVALLAKQAWRIINKPDCLLSKVMRGKYCSKISFLQVPETKSMSHGWRGILAGRDLLVTNLGKAIGNGEETRVWKDPWLSTEIPYTPMGPPPEGEQDLVVADLLCRGSMNCNIPRIQSLFPQLLPLILRLRPSLTGANDSYSWLATRTDEYSVKSGYYVAMDSASIEDNNVTAAQRTENQTLNKGIWASKTSPKLQLFLWKITHGALPLGENLAKRGLLAHALCCHCGELETAEHSFLQCTYAQRVWSSSIWKQEFNSLDTPSFAMAFLTTDSFDNLPPLGVKASLFSWICWGIWTARNHKIFENKIFSPEEVISKAIASAREWSLAQPLSPTPQARSTLRVSSLHQTGLVFSCHTDAAWMAATNRAGCGWCVLNAEGTVLLQGS